MSGADPSPEEVARLVERLNTEGASDPVGQPTLDGDSGDPWTADDLKLWITIRRANGIIEDPYWPDLLHSSLLACIAAGGPVFVHPPPMSYSYPWVWLCEKGWDIAGTASEPPIEGAPESNKQASVLSFNQSSWTIKGRYEAWGQPAWRVRNRTWRAKVEWEDGPFDVGDRFAPVPTEAFVIRLTHPAGPAPTVWLGPKTSQGHGRMDRSAMQKQEGETTPILAQFVCWDWKDSPPFDELSKKITSLIRHGATEIHFELPDGGDTYLLVISSRQISRANAEKAFNDWWDGGGEREDWSKDPEPRRIG